MAKCYETVGYSIPIETTPGVWVDQIVTRNYYCELTRNTSKFQVDGSQLNDNLNISNEISIVADPFATENFQRIRYISFMGFNWKITNVEVKYPRLILTIGGVYDGETPTVTESSGGDSGES